MPKRKKNDRKFCPHCDQYVCERNFYYHKKMFFSESEGSWMKHVPLLDSSSESDSYMSSSESVCTSTTISSENMSFTPTENVSAQVLVDTDNSRAEQSQLDFIIEKVDTARSILTEYENSLTPTKKLNIITEEKLMQQIEELDGINISPNLRYERKEAIREIQDLLHLLDDQQKNVPIETDESDSSIIETSTSDSTDTETETEMCNFSITENENSSGTELLQQYQTTLDHSNHSANDYLLYFLIFLMLWKAFYVISNGAIVKLLLFLGQFLKSLSVTDPILVSFTTLFPTSMYTVWKYIGINKNNFMTYVVCPKCTNLFRKEDIIVECHSRLIAKKCDTVQFSKGKYNRRCNTQLMKRVVMKNGRTGFLPFKQFPYRSVIDSLENMLCRPKLEELCEEWRTLKTMDNEYADVFDGEVWKSFQTYKGQNFLKSPNNYAFMVNVDWFQPFDRRKDISQGAIYLALLNLPRQLRFKRENMILLGVLPALSKEPASLNSFLKPMVEELLALWNGVRIKTYNQRSGVMVRAALLCASSDIPAARKLCGFLGHNARRGCSKCLKNFPGSFGEKKNYSGFDTERWPKRTLISHTRSVNKIKACQTATSRKKMESEYGCRFSVLSDLPYFNVIRHHVVDPMHNLFLGTAKRMFKVWIDNDILTLRKLSIIDEKLSKIEIPHDYGRLPSNIGSNWGSFTADQWKNWTLVHSLIALKSVLPKRDYNVWHTFSQACRIITKPVVTTSAVLVAEHLFRKFGREVENLYGDDAITMNMHLHCHLSESIKDYGSMYGFWLFSFERYNGILSSFNTNKHDIEIQLMKEFTTTDELLGLLYKLPSNIHENLLSIISSLFSTASQASFTFNDVIELHRISFQNSFEYSWCDFKCIDKPDVYKKKSLQAFDFDEKNMLLKTYKTLYPKHIINESQIMTTYFLYKSIHIGGEYFSSKKDYRGKKFANILASWSDGEGNIDLKAISRPGTVKYFFEHVIKLNEKFSSHLFAAVEWFKEETFSSDFPVPISSWKSHKFEKPGPASFIPVQRLHGKYASFCDKNTVHVIPMYRRILM